MSSSDRRQTGANRYEALFPALLRQAKFADPAEFRPLFPNSVMGWEEPGAAVKPSVVEPEPRVEPSELEEQWKRKIAEAEQALEEAREQARQITQEAEERGYQEGLRKGYEEGYQQGHEEGLRLLEEEISRVRQIAEGALEARQRLLSAMEPEIVSLALAIAKKVIGEEATRNQEVIAHMVHRAIDQLGRRGPYRIRLNPQDAQRLIDRWRTGDELDGEEWELIPDERIAVGGCIIESGPATVDARIDVQMEVIQNALLGANHGLLSTDEHDRTGN